MADYLQAYVNTFVEGVNQNHDVSLIKETQMAGGVNLSSRGGKTFTRPGFKELGVTIATGKFQGALRYHLSSGDRIVYVIDGVVYTLKLSDLSITNHGLQLKADSDMCFFCQADRYMVIQDDYNPTTWAEKNYPVILHEETLIDQSAEADNERVPKGTAMAYGHGRLFVVTAFIYESAVWTSNLGLVGFVAGDIIKAYKPTDVLLFTEETYLNEGGRLLLPEELGTIHSMIFQKNVMSGVGQGPLIIAAEFGMSAFSINAPRSTWKDIDLSVVMFSGADDVGSYANRAIINVNSEVMYRSVDGIRGMRRTATETQGGSLENEPLSADIRPLMELDGRDGQLLASMSTARSRVLLTSNWDGSVFKSLVSLDLAPLASMNQPSPAAFDGIWTGFDFQQVLSAIYNNTEKHFIFVEDNRLFYLDEDEIHDNLSTEIMCRAYTKEHIYGEPFRTKRVQYMELWLADVQGSLTITGYYNTDRFPFWSKFGSGVLTAGSDGYRRTQVRITPTDVDADDLGVLLDSGYGIQYCIQWTGHAKLLSARMVTTLDKTNKFTVIGCESESGASFTPTDDTVLLDDYSDYSVI